MQIKILITCDMRATGPISDLQTHKIQAKALEYQVLSTWLSAEVKALASSN